MILQAGREYLHDLCTGNETYADFKYRLFTSPASLTGTEELADFTFEDDAVAGAVVTLASADWSRSENAGTTEGEQPTKTFGPYDSAADNEVKGSAILDNTGTIVISATIGPGGGGSNLPATPSAGDSIEATPNLDFTLP